MKVICRNGNAVYIFSPQEVIEARQKSQTQEPFKHLALNGDSLRKITHLYTIHGFTDQDYALESCHLITRELSAQYNFQNGYKYCFGDSRIPIHLHKNDQGIKQFLEYMRLMLEAFGWIVNFGEDAGWYYFNFPPLLTLTPEEVSAEIKRRTDRIAHQAVQVINSGLLHHINIFSIEKLGLSNIDPMDYLLALDTITQLMGPSWTVIDKRDFTIYVTPTTPN